MSAPVIQNNSLAVIRWLNYLVGGTPLSTDPEGVLTTIDSPHHEIHEGNFYTQNVSSTINAGTANSVLVRIQPGATLFSHFQAAVTSNNSGFIELYENPSASGGSTLTPWNNYRESNNAYSGTITSGVTVATLGTLLREGFFGGNSPAAKFGGEARTNNEVILNRTWDYLLRVTADNATTRVALDIEIYEVSEM